MKNFFENMTLKQKLIAGIIFSLILIALICTAQYWFYPALVVVLLGLWCYSCIKEKNAEADANANMLAQERDATIFAIIFSEIQRTAPRIGLVKPTRHVDLRIRKQSPNVFDITVERLQSTPLAAGDLTLVATRLNRAFEARLQDDAAAGIYSPPLFVNKVQDEGCLLGVRIIVCDNQQTLDYIKRERPVQRPISSVTQTSEVKKIPILYDAELLREGIKQPLFWKPEQHPMFLCVGGTGSGKTYFLSLLMGKVSVKIPDSEIFLCDFKDIDFRDFSDCPRRWSYDACAEGLTAFYESCQARLRGEDTTTNRKFLVFDEWAAFVLSRDKKAVEEMKSKLSTLLMMGRGVQHHVIIGLQRADAQLFPMGGRDQFGVILALGNVSKEQRQMLFFDFTDQMKENNGRGEGYLLVDGWGDVRRVMVPTVVNVQKLNTCIRKALLH